MPYQVKWTLKAAKQAKKLHASDRALVIERIGALSAWPECKETLNIKPLTRHQYQYRLRVGRYRLLFDVETGLEVVSIEEVKKRDERTY